MNQNSCNILSITFHWNFATRGSTWILNFARRWTWILRRGREGTRRWSTENSPPSTPLKSPANSKHLKNSFEKSCKFETLKKLLWKVLQIWQIATILLFNIIKASTSSYLQELIEDVGQAAKLGGQEGSDPGVESPWNPWYTKDHGGDNLDGQMTMKSELFRWFYLLKTDQSFSGPAWSQCCQSQCWKKKEFKNI